MDREGQTIPTVWRRISRHCRIATARGLFRGAVSALNPALPDWRWLPVRLSSADCGTTRRAALWYTDPLGSAQALARMYLGRPGLGKIPRGLHYEPIHRCPLRWAIHRSGRTCSVTGRPTASFNDRGCGTLAKAAIRRVAPLCQRASRCSDRPRPARPLPLWDSQTMSLEPDRLRVVRGHATLRVDRLADR